MASQICYLGQFFWRTSWTTPLWVDWYYFCPVPLTCFIILDKIWRNPIVMLAFWTASKSSLSVVADYAINFWHTSTSSRVIRALIRSVDSRNPLKILWIWSSLYISLFWHSIAVSRARIMDALSFTKLWRINLASIWLSMLSMYDG
jgi:hypothetical protein